MVDRPFWISLIRGNLKRRPILWLAGVRRSGKTSLCHMLSEARYFDCELPSSRREIERDGFWENHRGKVVILDEIHRLFNPAETLKIAADHHAGVRVIATGSSTLAATAKFRDTLTGRKSRLWLTPANSFDAEAFGVRDFKRRLLTGGLPPFLLGDAWDERDYQEWLDSFWSRDIQELFRVGNRASFLKFFELVMSQSGGIFEAQKFAAPCEVSRPTIASYLSVLETTLTAHVVRPYSKRLATEIVSAPKVYGFDTGFVAFARGWHDLTNDRAGTLFEHWILNEFHSLLQQPSLNYWRDKAKHEVDFIWKIRGKDPIAIECKWQESLFESSNLKSFRSRHPEGDNLLITSDKTGISTFRDGSLKITHVGPASLRDWIQKVNRSH
jgi:uncharacterized protein